MAERVSPITPWVEKCEEYRKSIVSIECGPSIGTGWIAAAGEAGFLIATARHVVEEAIEKGTKLIFRHEDRPDPIEFDPVPGSILSSKDYDTAVITVLQPSPGPSLKMLHLPHPQPDPGRRMMPTIPLGVEVGWIGFPETARMVFGKPTVTFCQGHISAHGQRGNARYYCVDGNVNRGMSGGPVWDVDGSVLGIVVEYWAPVIGWTFPPQAQIPHRGFGLVIPIFYLMIGLEQAGAGYYSDDGRVYPPANPHPAPTYEKNSRGQGAAPTQ
jgi:hypothetical protein